MSSNLDKYKTDLARLISEGAKLKVALDYLVDPEVFKEKLRKTIKRECADLRKKELSERECDIVSNLPSFISDYNGWYSESHSVIKQLIPDRLDDFVSHYKKPIRVRKEITYENYVIQDALQGLAVTSKRGIDITVIADIRAIVPRFNQQNAMLKSAERKFESTLFDIKSLVQADIFDSEIDAAQELHKHSFFRAAGAVCGVVIEKHLSEVATNHKVTIKKKNPTISDLNDALKSANVIEVAQWRKHQYLADVRNKCDHNKEVAPTKEEVQELIDGVNKMVKTIF